MEDRERDAFLDEVLVGGREKRKIVIVDHDPRQADRRRARCRRRSRRRVGHRPGDGSGRSRSDRWRTSAEDRRAYEELKRALTEREWGDMNYYADAKGDLIETILAGADE
jgi:GrpB protein